MSVSFKPAALAAAIFLAGTNAGFARDQPGPDWISKEQAQEKAVAAGYTSVTGLKADDGYWEGKGVKNGKIMEFKLDPKTGAVVREKIDD